MENIIMTLEEFTLNESKNLELNQDQQEWLDKNLTKYTSADIEDSNYELSNDFKYIYTYDGVGHKHSKKISIKKLISAGMPDFN